MRLTSWTWRALAPALGLLLPTLACGGVEVATPPVVAAASPSAPSPAASPGDPVLVRRLVDQVSQAGWEATVRQLSGVDPVSVGGQTLLLSTRNSHTAGSAQAAEHLRGVLAGMGYAVTSQPFTCLGVSSLNLVASLPGSSASAARIVLGAHYDSTSDHGVGDAPGADDNASGVAAVVEAARVLRGHRLSTPVELVLFGAEEQGMCGSEHYVREARTRGPAVRGAVVLDMIAWYERRRELTVEGEDAWRDWMRPAAEAVTAYTDLAVTQTYESEDSDHVPFQMAGIPAYLIIESDWDRNPFYHSSGDTFANLDPAFGYQATRAVVATVATTAGLLD